MLQAAVLNEARQLKRGGGGGDGFMISSSSFHSGLNDFPKGDAIDEIQAWSVADVLKFLESKGYSSWCRNFEKHKISGKELVKLQSDDLKDMGIDKVGPRMQILDTIQGLTRQSLKPHVSELREPSWPQALVQIFTFAWAETSEGKSPSEQKEEIITANLSISLVSALLTGMTYEWFVSSTNSCFCSTVNTSTCYCSAGFDLSGNSLWIFYVLSGLSAACFLCCTIMSVLQVVAINEMSDDDELENFFELLGAHESLPGKLLAVGLCLCFFAVLVYILFNQRLGLEANDGEGFAWAMTVFYVILVMYGFVYALARMIKNVYIAKAQAIPTPDAEQIAE